MVGEGGVQWPSPPVSTDGAATQSKDKKRSRLGCIVCKQRKVKCDERPGGCTNCQRLEVPCPGYTAAPPAEHTEEMVEAIFAKAGRKRRRMLGSCKECRVTKSRCSGERPACERCLKKNARCEYENTTRSGSMKSSSPPATLSADISEGMGVGRNSWADIVLGQTDREVTRGWNASETDPMEWLCRPSLPESLDQLRTLVNAYFSSVHPLRSLSFIHKPSFMKSLDEGTVGKTFGDQLLLAMCALAANVIVWKSCPEDHRNWQSRELLKTSHLRFTAGNGWAQEAQRRIVADFGNISAEKLMAIVLLCEYYSRTKQHGSAFMLSGLAVRGAHALLLDVDHQEGLPSDPGDKSTAKESRRRLMWSCYALDLQMSSGVRRITTLQPENFSIPLPCQERNYLLQIPCTTESLRPPSIEAERAVGKDNLGLEAYYIRILYTRGTVLHQIRVRTAIPQPWMNGSRFLALTDDLEFWESDLPMPLRLNSTNIYIRLEQGQISALFNLHLMLHQTYCDLYRITMPGYAFPATSTFTGAPPEFLQQCRTVCHTHAMRVSEILEMALKHGYAALAEPQCITFAFESVRHQLVFLVSASPPRRELWEATARGLEIGLKVLHLCRGLMDIADECISYIHSLLDVMNLQGLLTPTTPSGPKITPAYRPTVTTPTATQMVPSDLNNIHPFASYRLARQSLLGGKNSTRTELHTPLPDSGTIPSPPSTVGGSADEFARIVEGHQGLLEWDPAMQVSGGLGEEWWAVGEMGE
ncbi:hypothetical protein EDC01DRAFT_405805 [Geopyxis carbonaria]|nr:hypothetical protein EDC01DRAFT_405805 [Geopyxis carbonaria]